MGTIIGIVIGVLATVAVGRYYYIRSMKKSITPYLVLNTRVFAGIDEEVRKELHFSFKGKEVKELQFLEFLVVNDGERAISNLIEPLKLSFPPGHRIMDASLLHRDPDSLKISLRIIHQDDNASQLEAVFPLLNKDEYFLVKLLVSGFVPSKDLRFSLLADDLPRSLKAKSLPLASLQQPTKRIDWASLSAGLVFLLLCAGETHLLYMLYKSTPTLFPWPWASFHATMGVISIGLGALFTLLCGIIAVMGLIASCENALGRKKKYFIPKELQPHKGLMTLATSGDIVNPAISDEEK
jgi:hypothetical protein